MPAVVHAGVAHTDAPGQFSQHPQVQVLGVQRKPSFKSNRATHSRVRSAEMELGGVGVNGAGVPKHVVVVLRSDRGVSLRMQTIVETRLKAIPVKSCNVEWNLAHSQWIASSMSGVSGAHAHVLALEHGSGQGLSVCRAEQMVNSVKTLPRRFRLAILSKVKIHQLVVSMMSSQSTASLLNGPSGQSVPPLADQDSKATHGR